MDTLYYAVQSFDWAGTVLIGHANAKNVTPNDLLFEVDLTSIFEVFSFINVKALATRLGMNYTLISQYATGKKKPSARQTEKIMEGIHQIGRELSELTLIA